MNGTVQALASNLLIVLAFVAIVAMALRVAQSFFGTDSLKETATESAAKLVTLPTATAGSLRRRFVRALTSQFVIMPSGKRHAFSELTLRVSPEDLSKLDPDNDLMRLGADAAGAYRKHATREGWQLPEATRVIVEVDPTLRSGWIPAAKGHARTLAVDLDPNEAAEATHADGTALFDDDEATELFGPPTGAMNGATAAARTTGLNSVEPIHVDPILRLSRQGRDIAVQPAALIHLGRAPESEVHLEQPEVSYQHAHLRCKHGQWQIMDVGSTNGTVVDGEQLPAGQWHVIADRCVIEIAGIALTAQWDTPGTVNLEALGRR